MFPKLEIEGVKDGIVNVGILTGITIQAVDVIGCNIETVATASSGIKIDGTNGLRAFDTFGNLAVQIDLGGGVALSAIKTIGAYLEIYRQATSSIAGIELHAGVNGDAQVKVTGNPLGTNDLFLEPFNGYVKFAVYQSLGAETLQGYMLVKDSSGNLRKLAVIA
jgi:hypothetical protein